MSTPCNWKASENTHILKQQHAFSGCQIHQIFSNCFNRDDEVFLNSRDITNSFDDTTFEEDEDEDSIEPYHSSNDENMNTEHADNQNYEGRAQGHSDLIVISNSDSIRPNISKTKIEASKAACKCVIM
jgi:hypothetical protein